MLIVRIFLLVICSIAPLLVHAEAERSDNQNDVLQLSIEDAVILALRNNRGLRLQQFEPIIAGAFEQIERGRYDAEIFARLEFNDESSSETARSTGEQFSVEGNDSSAELGVRQSLATGTEVEASVGLDRSISNRAPEQQQARFGLTVTQQLLRGFGPAVNLASIRQAELDVRASSYELSGYVEALIADVEATYWRCVALGETILIFSSSLAVAESQLRDVESRIEVGDLPDNAAAVARAEVALRKQGLIDATSAMDAQRYRLMRLIYPGMPEDVFNRFEAISRPNPEILLDLNTAESQQLALQIRPEIKQAQLLIERNELETVVTRNGRLPRLELFINLGKSGYSDTFRDSFRDADGPSYDASVGIEYSQFIGNRAAKGREVLAKATLEQSQESLANLRDLVRFDVLLAMNELDRARQQISAAAETRGYRQQALEAEQDRFEVGAATILDVSLVQRDLIESQIAEVRAQIDYHLAKLDLYLAEGSLLERRGITLEQYANGAR